MNRWDQIEKLFYEALLRKGDERNAFLNRECGEDQGLRREIDSLIAQQEGNPGFLEKPALAVAAKLLTNSESEIVAGQTFGSYRILSLLGKGGMGEVYRARDTRLQRDVALKFLTFSFASDPDRLSRFQREALVLASLNDPNIAQIYGLEGSGKSQCIVMELVEGETLQERLKHGPIPLEEALSMARQIAEALEAAHEKGIVHRDLKPANVKVKADGTVKVLDFGLAKPLENVSGGISKAPALDVSATNTTAILGTSAYMSPEQAASKAVDSRSDIFSFGSVLYEMLTGFRAFSGETFAEILTAVLKAEPDWTRLPPNTPTSIRRLLRRCLQKDLNRRLQDIADARIEIEESKNENEPSEQLIASTGSGRGRRIPWTIAALTSIAALILVIPAILFWREPPVADALEMRVDVVTPTTADSVSFAISPNGRRLVFVASRGGISVLWVRTLDSEATAQPVVGTEGASYPFWSPDSRSVGFFADGKLKRVDIAGGSPRTLAEAALGRGGTWSPDGLILFAPEGAGPLYRVPASGGKPVEATKVHPPEVGSHRFPNFLPFESGRHQFLFYGHGTPEGDGIYLGSMDSSVTKRLTAADTAGAYMPGGWLVFIHEASLLARRLDLRRGELIGEPVTLADSVNYDTTSYAGAFSTSATGIIAYRSGKASLWQLTWFDRLGKAVGNFGLPNPSNPLNPELSPDGKRVALDRTMLGFADVWIVDASRTTRFTFDAADDHWPIWSPNGDRIVFDSSRGGPSHDLYWKPSSSARGEELLLDTSQAKGANDWSSNGKFILYSSQDPKTGSDLWLLPMTGERKPQVLLKTGFEERNGQFSPDSRWVAYESNESGRFEVYVRPVSGDPALRWQISTQGGLQPRWKSDGRELYYIALDQKLMAVPIALKETAVEPGTPLALFSMQASVVTVAKQQYDVAPDGRFLFSVPREDAASSITLLLNWKPPAK
jgi:eukaryotic-like serine/threonine-protein kinase